MPHRDPSKVLLSVRIDAEVARKVRDYVRCGAGAPDFLRLGTWVQAAIEAHLAAAEAKQKSATRLPRTSPASNSHL